MTLNCDRSSLVCNAVISSWQFATMCLFGRRPFLGDLVLAPVASKLPDPARAPPLDANRVRLTRTQCPCSHADTRSDDVAKLLHKQHLAVSPLEKMQDVAYFQELVLQGPQLETTILLHFDKELPVRHLAMCARLPRALGAGCAWWWRCNRGRS